MELLTSVQFLPLYAVLFGTSMKIADLLDEHGMCWFREDKIVFGILWGVFGSLILLSGNAVANLMIALLIHWILRFRIDYLNHGIAATLILLTFVYNLSSFLLDNTLFLTIFIVYTFHGLLNDIADGKKVNRFWVKYFSLNSHYLTVPIILTLINYVYWPVLVVSSLHVISYEATKYIAARHGYN